MTACIIGWAHTPFGRLDSETVESLIVRAATEALADAGVAASEVDEILLGHFNAGFSAQDFTASLVLQASPDLRFKRATRVENACATGSAAVHHGLQAIKAGAARIVLVVGVEQMTTTPPAEIGRNLLKASYVRDEADIEGGFAGIFGQIAARYFQKYGDQSDALALIAAKNHKNGVANPYAQMRKDLGFAFCRTREREEPVRGRPAQAHRLLAGLGRRRRPGARRRRDRARHAQGGGVPLRRPRPGFPADVEARHPQIRGLRARLGSAPSAPPGSRSSDLSFVETHDCFTIAELIEYEAMGLVPEGEGARAITEGMTLKDGPLPVNPSGGLKSKGHPIGATGVSMHALSAMQLCGRPATCRCATPRSAASSTWAAPRSPTTSASWSGSGRRRALASLTTPSDRSATDDARSTPACDSGVMHEVRRPVPPSQTADVRRSTPPVPARWQARGPSPGVRAPAHARRRLETGKAQARDRGGGGRRAAQAGPRAHRRPPAAAQATGAAARITTAAPPRCRAFRPDAG